MDSISTGLLDYKRYRIAAFDPQSLLSFHKTLLLRETLVRGVGWSLPIGNGFIAIFRVSYGGDVRHSTGAYQLMMT
jgi:hypothetical protein